jgi:hypothetical protein
VTIIDDNDSNLNQMASSAWDEAEKLKEKKKNA